MYVNICILQSTIKLFTCLLIYEQSRYISVKNTRHMSPGAVPGGNVYLQDGHSGRGWSHAYLMREQQAFEAHLKKVLFSRTNLYLFIYIFKHCIKSNTLVTIDCHGLNKLNKCRGAF